MVAQITRQKYFRWHDAGDVQDEDHLMKIYAVCKLTPHVKHWMPTREAWMKDHLHYKPDNLVIRFSPPMIGQENTTWPNSSMVVLRRTPAVQLHLRATAAATVERAGILQLRLCHMENTKQNSLGNKAISPKQSTDRGGRAPFFLSDKRASVRRKRQSVKQQATS